MMMARGRKQMVDQKARNKATKGRQLSAELAAISSTGKRLAKEMLDEFVHAFAERVMRF
jgi:hypothetical protein